ncbi:MAG: phosphoribosylanthranilate isomerase [Desulfovibrio sp.]|nr:phosphoribosylanthranilate isomerase [Desulfovibrio sp.]
MKRPLIKICGLTSGRDARECMRLGADFVGFVFHPPSPRSADPAMVARVRSGPARKVGVFVDQDVSRIVALEHQCGLDMVQLHGGHGPDERHGQAFCRCIAHALGPERIIKVFWPERYESPQALQNDLDRFARFCGWMLLDAGQRGGGHGRIFDSQLLKGVRPPRPWLLAGGLGPGNLAQARMCFSGPGQSQPHGFDMSSGVETAPGKKDLKKVEQSIHAVHGKAGSTALPGREE